MSLLSAVGHQYFSICSITSSVPCACVYEGPRLRVVHGVGEVADQHAADAPFRHLFDGERPVQHAHVRVDAHEQQIVDLAQRSSE